MNAHVERQGTDYRLDYKKDMNLTYLRSLFDVKSAQKTTKMLLKYCGKNVRVKATQFGITFLLFTRLLSLKRHFQAEIATLPSGLLSVRMHRGKGTAGPKNFAGIPVKGFTGSYYFVHKGCIARKRY